MLGIVAWLVAEGGRNGGVVGMGATHVTMAKRPTENICQTCNP